MDRRFFIAAGTCAALASHVGPASAQTYVESQALTKRARDYLQNLKVARGRFTQTDARGAASSGTLYLNRPGKARFEYDAPAALLIVSDGRFVGVSDRRLKTFERYPLGASPLGIFLSRRISLEDEVRVTKVSRTDGGFSVTVRDARGNADGSLTLDFADAPLTLRGWSVSDVQGLQTRVRLTALTPTSGLDPSLFKLEDPRAG